VVIFRDVTSKHKAATALIEAKEQAERASRAKSEFLSMMSHELRTPLNSILGFSQIMLDDSGNPLNSVQRERVHKILKASRHLIELINEILDHTQFEAGRVRLLPESLDLHAIIEDSIRLVQPLAELKGIAIDCHIEN